ncbi:unnamed protein product [Onchocerca ochengi]|uniref:Helicase_PWI domain-containing protein n=1 Tax=Onchocerca ochengi TaxID=42157 RepID=A0A182EQU1_ONCOC|nr:unnamed protein product [Onchocerca ochengi]
MRWDLEYLCINRDWVCTPLSSCSQILDSDDDDVDDNYLEKVKDGCISEYQSAEERELDRQLTLLGIGTDNGSLLSSLTDQEKKTFTLFYDKLLAQEAGLHRSVFAKKQEPK